MEELDCCFEKENKRFRYRAAAIIIEDNCVLFAGNEEDEYYYSIGGGVHLGETSEEAVVREVYEETGVEYEVDRLAFIHENLFEGKAGALKGKECHEISFYYLMKPRGTKQLNSDSYTKGIKEEVHWVPIDKLSERKSFPTFFKDKLINLNQNIEHIVTIQE